MKLRPGQSIEVLYKAQHAGSGAWEWVWWPADVVGVKGTDVRLEFRQIPEYCHNANAVVPMKMHSPKTLWDPCGGEASFRFTWEEYEKQLNSTVKETTGCESVEELEKQGAVRAANRKLDTGDTDGQSAAQYGSLLPRAGDRLLKEILKVAPDEIFVDIGHGIGE